MTGPRGAMYAARAWTLAVSVNGEPYEGDASPLILTPAQAGNVWFRTRRKGFDPCQAG